MNILKMTNISKEFYNGEGKQIVLDSCSWDFDKGMLTSITGPSGTGKSTLLNILGGLEKPSSGTVSLDSQPVDYNDEKELADYRRDNVSIIFQDFNLVSFLNGQENALLPNMISRNKDAAIEEKFESLAKELGIFSKRGEKISNLSGGEKQRIAILRALLQRPKVLLADEPTGSLDQENTNKFMDILQKLSYKFRLTTIVVTHDKEVESFCDVNLELFKGKLIRKK